MPSRGTVLRLAERLDMPLRERNVVLLAAGFAPAYVDRGLEDPAMAAASEAIRMILKGSESFPALAVDRHWNRVVSSGAVARLLAGIEDESLLQPPSSFSCRNTRST